jgi:hypothetical protein
MTGARQTIAVIITFRKTNKNLLEGRAGSCRSSRKNTSYIINRIRDLHYVGYLSELRRIFSFNIPTNQIRWIFLFYRLLYLLTLASLSLLIRCRPTSFSVKMASVVEVNVYLILVYDVCVTIILSNLQLRIFPSNKNGLRFYKNSLPAPVRREDD